MAGESARARYERIRERRRAKFRLRWPLALVATAAAFALGFALPGILMSVVSALLNSLAPDGPPTDLPEIPTILSVCIGVMLAIRVGEDLIRPSHAEVAWRRGASGERKVGRTLDALSRKGVHALHDRLMPGSKGNIDHLAVTGFGVFTVDSKRYAGRLQLRSRGSELWINGRNRSALLEQGRRQAESVRSVLRAAGYGEVPVVPVLCFVGTKLPLLFPPRHARGVVLTTPQSLRRRLVPRAEAVLQPGEVRTIVQLLDARMRPAAR
jgi:hypothetical protein